LQDPGRILVLNDANSYEIETTSSVAASTMGAFRKRSVMVEEIDPQALCAAMNSGELWQVVDVREPWEIEIANIRGTIDIPMGNIMNRLDELDPTWATAVLCHSGGRSLRVATFLAANGFARFANVSGGIDRWSLTVDPKVARY
jgi:adenylyltransferase/sulfurtransferase